MAELAEVATADLPIAGIPAQGRWSGYQIYLITILTLVVMCNTMDRSIMSLLQEAIKRDLSLSDEQLGLISGPAFALFYSVAGFPVARLAERFNRPRLVSSAIAFWSAMTALCGLVTGFASLATLRAAVGIGEGGANPSCHSLLADEFSVRQRGMAMSVLSSATPISKVIVPVTTGAVALIWGWRTAFVVMAIPGFILALILWFGVREPRHTSPMPIAAGTFLTDSRWLFGNRAFVFVVLAGAFNGIGIQGTGIFTTSFLIRGHHLNIAQAGGIVSLLGLGAFIGTMLGGYLADRFADARGRSYVLVPAVGAVLSTALYTLGFRAESLPAAIVLLVAANFSSEIKNGPNLAAVQNIVPSRMRATAAAYFFFGATVIGTSLGAALVGYLSDSFARSAFSGDYARACVAGHGAIGLGPGVNHACATAAARGLQAALLIIPLTFIAAAVFFWLASRTIRVNQE